MQHAAKTYGAVANQTANPRELEADLLLTAAAQLQAIRDGWEGKRIELNAALLYNRKLWSIFVTSATSKENPLPAACARTSPIWDCSCSSRPWRSSPIQSRKTSARSSI